MAVSTLVATLVCGAALTPPAARIRPYAPLLRPVPRSCGDGSAVYTRTVEPRCCGKLLPDGGDGSLSDTTSEGDFIRTRHRRRAAARRLRGAARVSVASALPAFVLTRLASPAGLLAALAAGGCSVLLLRRGYRREAERSSWALSSEEAFAVQEVADEESELMEGAPREALHSCAAVDAHAEPGYAAAAMRSQGVVRIRDALDGQAALALMAHVNAVLLSRIATVEQGGDEADYFGGVRNELSYQASATSHIVPCARAPCVLPAAPPAQCPSTGALSYQSV